MTITRYKIILYTWKKLKPNKKKKKNQDKREQRKEIQ